MNPNAKKETGPRKCPKSHNLHNDEAFRRRKKLAVTIDECPECAGVWLDAGELHEVHGEYNTEAEKEFKPPIRSLTIHSDRRWRSSINNDDEEQAEKFLRGPARASLHLPELLRQAPKRSIIRTCYFVDLPAAAGAAAVGVPGVPATCSNPSEMLQDCMTWPNANVFA